MTVRFTVGGVLWLGLRTWLRGALRFLVIPLLLGSAAFVWYAALDRDTKLAFNSYFFRQHPIVRDLASGRYVLMAMATAAITHAAAAALAGRRPPIGSALKASVLRFFPVVGIAILSVALSSLWAELVEVIDPTLWRQGWPHFVQWGLMSIVRSLLYLAIPIAVLERRGLVASVVRGLALTRGARLRVWAIVALLVGVSAGTNSLLWIALQPDFGNIHSDAFWRAVAIIGFVTFGSTLLGLSVSAVINTVAYRLLRDAKQGPPPDELAQVFA
jgi:hypothetical protein